MFVKLAVLACVATVAFGQWGGNQNALDAGAYTGDGDYHGEGLQEAGAFGDVSQNWNDNNGQQNWNAQPQQNWNAQPQQNWNAQPQQNWNAQPQQNWNSAPQQNWNAAPQQNWNAAPQQNWAGRSGQPGLLPAGVDAGACPNYPFCH